MKRGDRPNYKKPLQTEVGTAGLEPATSRV